MTILVTGGAGFIGSNFILWQRREHPEDRLVCLDALTYAGRRENLAELDRDPGFCFLHGDIRDRAAVDRALTGVDAVVHFAAESHVDRSISGPELFTQTNVLGTAVLLEACRGAGVSRFHQVSTDEVYGDLPLEGPEPAFTEASPLRPSSPYAASKAAADLLALSYHRTYGLAVTVSRCGNNYGPRQDPEKLIPRVLTLAMDDRPVPVYADGRNVRDWIYVDDHCAALDCILRRGAPGGVYNVGARGQRDNLSLVKELLGRVGKPERLITFTADRPGHDLRYAIDPTYLEKTLGWRARTPMDRGLDETVAWYLARRQQPDTKGETP